MIERRKELNYHSTKTGTVVYWTTREHRVRHNWSLSTAYEIARRTNSKLIVVACLRPDLGKMGTRRLMSFMLNGLKEMESDLQGFNTPFEILLGDPIEVLPNWLKRVGASNLVCDLYPIKPYTTWQSKLAKMLPIPMTMIDAHNVIPVWQVSNKQEYAARTIRPKIHKLLPDYLDESPTLAPMPSGRQNFENVNWSKIESVLRVDESVGSVDWIKPGYRAACHILNSFIKNKLAGYANDRNDPSIDGLSNLSPYLHFGHISTAQVVTEILKTNTADESKSAFIEELIVRRELAENFCYFNPNYDNYRGFPNWAYKTIEKHKADRRDYIYDFETFEKSKTHDLAWNAAQNEMMKTGKMHGYMRMYWAKKILEWTQSAQEAQKIAIYLNDKYELDGRDPNGYTGIAWSMGGVHDRPWFERPVFGTVRYMNFGGLKRKFDVQKYIDCHLFSKFNTI